MKTRTALALALPVLLAAPAVVTAPAPSGARRGGPSDLVGRLRASGLLGWDLVDEATAAVHRAYAQHSLWHLWDTPGASLRHGHGWSAQYNQALAEVLRELGLDVQVVHAARVRGLGRNPWWQAGHTWLRVTIDGRTRDVCAGRAGNRAGQVGFTPTSEVRPLHPWTRATVSLALAPVVAVQAWRQLLGAPVPRWLHRPFDEAL